MRISDWSSDVCSSDLSSRKLSKVSLSCFVAPLVVEAPVPELTPETAIISSLDVDIHAAVGDPGQSSRSLLDKGRFLIVGMGRDVVPAIAVRLVLGAESLAAAVAQIEAQAAAPGLQPGVLQRALQQAGVALQHVQRIRPVGQDGGAHPAVPGEVEMDVHLAEIHRVELHGDAAVAVAHCALNVDPKLFGGGAMCSVGLGLGRSGGAGGAVRPRPGKASDPGRCAGADRKS